MHPDLYDYRNLHYAYIEILCQIYLGKLYNLKNKLIKLAKDNQKDHDDQHMNKMIRKQNDQAESPFEIGDYVLLSYPNNRIKESRCEVS